MLLSVLWSLTASFLGQPKLTPQLKSAFTAAEAMRRELVSLHHASLLHETLSAAPFDMLAFSMKHSLLLPLTC